MTVNADLTDRRIMIVGASSGLGRASALAAAKAGASVAVVGRRENLLDEVVSQATEASSGGKAVRIVADVCDESSASRAVDEAVAGMGGIDALLLPLAWSPFGLLSDMDVASWQKAMMTNVVAPSLLTRFAAPVLAEGGFVGYVSSTSAEKPAHGLGVYAASKAALEHTIRTWRLERTDIRFTRFVIGPTLPTDLYRDYDLDKVNQVLPLWALHGLMEVSFMAVDEVGTAVAEACAWMLAHPTIVLEDVVLKPPIKTMSAAEVEALARTNKPGDDSGELPPADTTLGAVRAQRAEES